MLGVGYLIFIVYFNFMTFAEINVYIVSGLIVAIGTAIVFLFRPEQKTLAPQIAKLKFRKPVVKKSIDYQHGGVYHRSDYYLPVENVKRDIVAENCVGSINLIDSNIGSDNYAIWDKNNDSSINIGHVEYLRLFLVSNFVKDGNSENYFYMYRKSQADDIPNNIEFPYYESQVKLLEIKIQSTNAIYPSEPYQKSVEDIVKIAKED